MKSDYLDMSPEINGQNQNARH